MPRNSLQKRMQTPYNRPGAHLPSIWDSMPANYLTNIPDHHQIIVDHTQPLGEGNSVFISRSVAKEDPKRAPAGMRAATLSTHTAVSPWWQLRQHNTTQVSLSWKNADRYTATPSISRRKNAIPWHS